MNRTIALLFLTFVIPACAEQPAQRAGVELNPYVCNDNEPNDHLAQLSLCRGGGLSPF